MDKDQLIRTLRDSLQAASDHLHYCNFGDKWENECAYAAKLPDQIARALKAAEEYAPTPVVKKRRAQ